MSLPVVSHFFQKLQTVHEKQLCLYLSLSLSFSLSLHFFLFLFFFFSLYPCLIPAIPAISAISQVLYLSFSFFLFFYLLFPFDFCFFSSTFALSLSRIFSGIFFGKRCFNSLFSHCFLFSSIPLSFFLQFPSARNSSTCKCTNMFVHVHTYKHVSFLETISYSKSISFHTFWPR